MKRPTHVSAASGFSLIETLVVLALVGLCLSVGSVSLAHGLRGVEARGTAEIWQAAAARSQVGAVWSGEARELRYDSGRFSVAADVGTGGGEACLDGPSVPVLANIVRWRQGQGVVVRFVGGTGSPDGAGSLSFRALANDYRVTVRLESGLTTRTWIGSAP